jgi:hypothetical protein
MKIIVTFAELLGRTDHSIYFLVDGLRSSLYGREFEGKDPHRKGKEGHVL